MATEEDKPESAFTMEKEKKNKVFFTEDSSMVVDELLIVETKQEEYLLDKSQGSKESNFRIEYPMNDVEGSYVSKTTEEESKDSWKYQEECRVGEDDEVEHKFPTTTALFKGDPLHTSSSTNKEYSGLLSPPTDTKILPEMLHSSVTVLDDIKERRNNSDFAEKVSMEGDNISSCSAFPNENNDIQERENGYSNMGQLSSPLAAELKNDMISMKSDTVQKLEENSGTEKEHSQDLTKLGQETKENSNELDLPGLDNIESSNNDRQSSSCENPKSISEFSEKRSMNIKESHTEIEHQNKSLDGVVEANSCKIEVDTAEESSERCNQSTVEPDDIHTDSLHDGVPPEIAASGENSPSVISIQEQTPTKSDQENLHEEDYRTSYAGDTKMEDSIQEYTGTHIEEVLDAQRTGDQKDNIEKMKEEMPEGDLKSSTLEMYRDYSVAHDQNNREEYINQAIKGANLPPEEVNQDTNPSNLEVEEYIGNTENAEQNRQPESAKEECSRQEFEILAQANEPADEANNLELLDVKDLSYVTSNEISKVVSESTKDVIWEQKEVPSTKESEEIKEVNEQLAHATNLVSQSSEENSSNDKAIDPADGSTDNRDVSGRKREKEETSKEKAHGEDKSPGTSDRYLHENPQEIINSTRIGLSSEEMDYAKLKNIPGPALQHKTTKPEQAEEVSIINQAENETAAGRSTTANESKDHSANMHVYFKEIQTVEYYEEYKTAEDNDKEITNADPECKSVDAVVENGTSSASFATTHKEVVPQKEENKDPGSDARGDPTKEIEDDHNGAKISESEPKEYHSVKDDPLTVECQNSKEAAMEEKTETGENINSERINTDVEYLELSLSLEKENQTIMKDGKYEEAKEHLPTTDKIRESEIPSSQGFSKQTEMKKEKHTTKEKDAIIEIRNLNQIQEASTSDNLVEKQVGDKSSAEDSRCGSLQQEVNQETYQEGELKPGLYPRETAAIISEDTKQLEEPEKIDATLSFKKQMTSEQKVVEGPSIVSMDKELADYGRVEEGKVRNLHDDTNPEIKMPSEDKDIEAPSQVSTANITGNNSAEEENKEERNLNGTKQEEDSEVNADELKSRVDGSKKFEEPETIHTTQNVFLKKLQNEEKTVERPHRGSIAEQIVHTSPAEKEEERNVNETKKNDELKPDMVPVAAEEMSKTINNSSNNTKIPSDNEIDERPAQVAREIVSDCFAEEEELSHVEKTAPDDLMLEIHYGVKIEEPKMIGATQRFYTEKQREDIIVERPPEFSIPENAVNYNATEEGIKEQIVTDTAAFQDELYPDVNQGTKGDEITETMRKANESTEFRQPETIEATWSFNTQMISEDKVIEQPHQFTTAEGNEKIVKDTSLNELKLEEVPRFEGPETANMDQSFKNPLPIEDKVLAQPPHDSVAQEVINYSTREDVKDTIISNGQQSTVDPEEEDNEISLAIIKASDSTKVDNTWHSNEAMINEGMVIEGPSQVSTEEIPNNVPEQKIEGNAMDSTIRDELKTEVDKLMEHGIPQTIKIASETTKSKEPQTIEAVQRSNTGMEIQDKEVFLVSFAEKAVKCNLAEEKKEDNVNDTRGDELKPAVDPEVKVDETFETTNNASQTTKLEGTNMIDAAQCFKKQTPCNNQVDEEPCQVLTAEKTKNYAPAEKGKEEWYVSNSIKKGELKSEVYTEVKNDEISETINSGSLSAKMMEAKQSCEMQMKSEDKVVIVEELRQALTSEEKINYSLQKEEEENANDPKAIDELNQEVDPEEGANEISGTTYHTKESIKFQEAEAIAATRNCKKQMQGEDKVVEGPTRISNTEELVDYNPAIERKAERSINETKTDEIKPEMASEEKIVEGPPKDPEDSISKKILNYSPSEKGKKESNLEDTTTKDELKIEGNPNVEVDEISETTSKASETTKFEEHEQIYVTVTQSFEKQIPHEDSAAERPNESPITEEIVNHIPEEEVMEGTIKYANAKEVSESKDTGVNSDETSETTINASASTKVREQNEDEKFPNQVQYHFSLIVEEDSEREVQSKSHLRKRPTDGMLPESEGREERTQVDDSNKEIAQKDDLVDDLTEANNDSGANCMPFESSIAVSNLEITAREDFETDNNAKIASKDEEMPTMHKGPTGAIVQPKIKELEPEDASKAVAKAVSSIPHETSSKDDKMEEKFEEQIQLSGQTGVTKQHKYKNEDTKFPDQDEYHHSLLIEQDSARVVQIEPHLNKRPTEGMSPSCEGTEAANQVENSNTATERKDNLVDDLTEANNNFGAILSPFESSIEASKGPKTSIGAKVAREDEEMSTMQKGPPGEILQQEIKELKPEDEFKVVAGAMSNIKQESRSKDDKMEEQAEEQVKLSKQTSFTKQHEDENEDKKIQDQDEYHSSFTMDDSAKEDQGEPHLNKRPTEEMFLESEVREAINQVDNPNKVIAQKDDITETDINFEAIQRPPGSSIAVSDFEILAEEDPKTGTDPKNASQDEEMSTMLKGPCGEMPKPETEELKPKEDSKVVSRAVSDIPQESSFKDDEMEDKDAVSINTLPEINLEAFNTRRPTEIFSQEQVKLSKQTSITKLHEDENEAKKIQGQNENYSYFTVDDSAKETQKEPCLSKKPTEGMLSESEVREARNQVDNSNKGIAQKDDLTEAKNNYEAIHMPFESSIAVSDLEILAEEDSKAGTEPEIASQDEEMSIMQKGPSGETLQPETEELKSEDASQVVSRAASDIPQESSFKDDEAEEKIEEPVKLSKQTSATKLHGNENEDKKIQDQDQYHSSLTMDDSAKEVQSEPCLNKRPTAGMLPDSEVREAGNQIDNPNKAIGQKDYITEANINFEAIQAAAGSSFTVSDLEILAEEDTKPGTDPKIASQDDEMSIMQKGPPGETLQPETEELKLEDASKVVSRAVSDIAQGSSFKDDEMEEKVEEQVKLSQQTSITKLHEDKKIEDQNETYSSFTVDNSAKETQSETCLSKKPSEEILSESEVREVRNQVHNSNKAMTQKDDLTEAKNDYEAIHTPFESSIAVSDLEIFAEEDPKTGTDPEIASQAEEMSTMQKGPPSEILQPETEELKPEDAVKVLSRAVSNIPQENSFKDDGTEEKIEEPVKPSKQTSATKLHGNENEDKQIQDQDEYHSSLTMDDSAREVQSDPHLNKKPTEGMSPECEATEATNQVDNSNKAIRQKDYLTKVNNFEDIHTPFKSSTAVSNLEILAKEDPITGTDPEIASQAEEMSIMQKGSPGEILQQETEELKPEHASKVVSREVNDIPQDSSFKDDEMEEKVEEQLRLSKQVCVTKQHEDEEEKIHEQDVYHSYFTIDDPAKAVQSEPHLKNKATEGLSPEREGQEATNQDDHSNKGIAQKDDLVDDLTEDNNESGAIHTPSESSIAASNLEILAEEDPKTGTAKKIVSEDEEVSIMQIGPTHKTRQPEREELNPGDAFSAEAAAVSGIKQESIFKDDGIEEKLEEQVKLSKQTSLAKLREDENEDTSILDQDECHSSFTMDDSAKEVLSEPHLSKRPTEGMLPESEVRKTRNQVDNLNKGIAQNDDLTAASNNSGAIHTPFESSTVMSDLEIKAEDHKTLIVANKVKANDSVDVQIVEVALKSETEKPTEKADPNFRPIETSDLEEVQQEKIAASFVENQQPANFNEDKGNGEEMGKSTSEETSMTSVRNLLQISRNENSKVAGDFKTESEWTIQRDEMNDRIAGTLGCDKPNNDEEVEEDTQRKVESAYDNPVIVEASREEADAKVTHKKSHNILSGVGSKVKHSIAKVKKVITGKSSHPKPSSPK